MNATQLFHRRTTTTTTTTVSTTTQKQRHLQTSRRRLESVRSRAFCACSSPSSSSSSSDGWSCPRRRRRRRCDDGGVVLVRSASDGAASSFTSSSDGDDDANSNNRFAPSEEETEKQFREQSLNRLKQFIDETASDPERAMKDPKTVGQKVLKLIVETCEIWNPPKFLWRTAATLLLAGNVCYRLLLKPVKLKKRINAKQTIEQIARIGPETLGVAMMTSSFVGLVFTIQFCKEFSKVGLKNVIGGLLGLAFARELTPVICAIVLAGRVGSAIAAELGTMQVTEQVDQLTVLDTDPVDYLVIPRVLACMISLPILSLISFAQSMAASIILADFRYGVSPNVVIDSAAKYLELSDIGVMSAKSVAFGAVIAVISCGWGTTTIGGAKGVGESTTASVVISLVAIFVVDFVLSMVFFNK
jgi:ABC transport permease subunit